MENNLKVDNLNLRTLDLGYTISYSIEAAPSHYHIRGCYDECPREYKEEAFEDIGGAITRFKELDSALNKIKPKA